MGLFGGVWSLCGNWGCRIPLCGNWGCTEAQPQFPQSYDRCNIYAQPSRGGEQYLCEVAMQINYWSLIINLWCFVIKCANSSVQPQFPQSGKLVSGGWAK